MFTKRVRSFSKLLLCLAGLSWGSAKAYQVMIVNTESLPGPDYDESRPVHFMDPVKGDDGEIALMTREEAQAKCASETAHLPTAREWARLAISRGAGGILEYNEMWKNDVTSRSEYGKFQKIRTINPDGKTEDVFSFNWSGYQRPVNELHMQWFWSSSIESTYGTKPSFLFVLGGFETIDSGSKLDLHLVDSKGRFLKAVRCVAGTAPQYRVLTTTHTPKEVE